MANRYKSTTIFTIKSYRSINVKLQIPITNPDDPNDRYVVMQKRDFLTPNSI